jgi:diacylglycerol kinase (ATP)
VVLRLVRAEALRLIRALRYSLLGLQAAVLDQAAFRIELALSVLLVPLALWLGETAIERALLAVSWLQVLVVELINSAIEAAVDRIGPERHRLSGIAKDIGSAAVLLSLACAALVWLVVLIG